MVVNNSSKKSKIEMYQRCKDIKNNVEYNRFRTIFSTRIHNLLSRQCCSPFGRCKVEAFNDCLSQIHDENSGDVYSNSDGTSYVSENQADPEPSYNALGNSNLSQKLGHTVFTYIH